MYTDRNPYICQSPLTEQRIRFVQSRQRDICERQDRGGFAGIEQ
jgi:hypothetical protein